MINKTSDSYKKHIIELTLGPLLKMIEAIFDLLIPLFMKTIIDMSTFNGVSAITTETNPIILSLSSFIKLFGTWVENENLNYALIGGTIILIMGVLGFITTMCTQYIAAKTAVQVGTEVRDSLYQKILTLSKKERENISNARLLTTLNADTYQIQQGVLIFIRLIVRAPFIILGALIISLILSWKIGLIFLCIIPLIVFVIFYFMRKSSSEYLGIQKRLDNISVKMSDSIEGSKVIRAFNREEYENKSFIEKTNDYKNSSIHVGKLNSMINPLTFAIISVAIVCVVLFGGIPMLNSADSISSSSMIITEIAYLTQIFTTLVQLTNVVMILTKAKVSQKRVDEILNIKPSIVDKEGAIKKEIKKGDEIISFNDVSLGYLDHGNLALKDINFSLNKGDSLGIIGGTGSGKSTLINLIERFLDATEGVVKYKGSDIKDYPLNNLRTEIGYVMQKSTLFKGTILSNMRMAKSDATEDEITQALKDACAYEFVSKYDDYLNHEVEEGGKNFSGGQRQRLCIARTLLKRPELLILDDSTSALDLLTDKTVRKNIEERYQGITKIIISQRVSTVSECSMILVLDGGRLIDKGTHEELLKTSTIYKETYDSQVKKGDN